MPDGFSRNDDDDKLEDIRNIVLGNKSAIDLIAFKQDDLIQQLERQKILGGGLFGPRPSLPEGYEHEVGMPLEMQPIPSGMEYFRNPTSGNPNNHKNSKSNNHRNRNSNNHKKKASSKSRRNNNRS